MDHSLTTTAKLTRRSNQEEILEETEACTKLALREFKDTGRIGNFKNFESLEHVGEVAYGLAVESARRQTTGIPPFDWDRTRGPKFIWDKHKIPYSFTPETRADYEAAKRAHEKEKANPWAISPMDELRREIDEEDKLKELDAEERKDLGLDDEVDERSSREKIRDALVDLHEKRGTQVHASPSASEIDSLALIKEKAARNEELTSSEKIKWGL